MVDILLSTYNGGEYLRELLDSLLNQTYKDIRILIRDDGSNDNTRSILKEYLKSNNNIVLITDDLGNIGSTKSFLTLLKQSSSEYIAFCDQDDIWDINKIEICIEELSKHNKPTLVFSDLELIDEEDNLLNKSYFKYMNRNPNKNNFKTIVRLRGLIPGCSMVFNKQLKDIVKYNNIDNIDIHDLYLSYVAACFGQIVYIDKQLVKYRQTGNNQIGTNKKSLMCFMKGLLHNPKETIVFYFKATKRYILFFFKSKSISEFCSIYYKSLDKKDKSLLFKLLSNKGTVK